MSIHIELASNLSWEAFLAVLRRFIARRGRCSFIFSDNGTNFIGANKLFHRSWNTPLTLISNLTLQSLLCSTFCRIR